MNLAAQSTIFLSSAMHGYCAASSVAPEELSSAIIKNKTVWFCLRI